MFGVGGSVANYGWWQSTSRERADSLDRETREVGAMFSKTVDVYVADLRTVAADEDTLSVAELGRALELGTSAGLDDYVAAHTWLRERLSDYLGVEPAAIEFGRGEFGKPMVVEPISDLTFNLAYADGLAVLAVGFRAELGVDVEPVSDTPVHLALVAETLSAAERDTYETALQQTRAFLRFWVRKESLAKALGHGIDHDMKATDVSGIAPVAVGDKEVVDLGLGDGVVGAVTVPEGTRLAVTIDESASATSSGRSLLRPAAVAS